MVFVNFLVGLGILGWGDVRFSIVGFGIIGFGIIGDELLEVREKELEVGELLRFGKMLFMEREEGEECDVVSGKKSFGNVVLDDGKDNVFYEK